MDLDEEILQRLTNTEDHFTERKSSPQHDDCKKAIIAFANSALPNKPGILYVGVNSDGEILDNGAPESWQIKLGKWANECYPQIEIIPRSLNKGGKPFLAVVVPLSPVRPHFLGPAYKRIPGPSTVSASQREIDEWIAYRSSKVRLIVDWKGKVVTVKLLTKGDSNVYGPRGGDYKILDCNEHFITLQHVESSLIMTEPLSQIALKMDDDRHRLMLLFTGYR
jgi:hypothetical protein